MTKWFFILSLIFTMPVFSQTTEKKSVAADSIISFQTMHVHFDKDIYLPGETIWFKAYLYNVNEISITATNFYAAIYDENGKLIQQKQYPILEGSCNGDFEIPDTIESSRIQFRAFTKAMIIDDTNNVYQKILTVYNKESNTENIGVSKVKQLQFFPEGGQMIAELENHIAFKATYTGGTPAIVSGQIVEVERNKVVDTFSTNGLGIGKIILSPLPRKNYIAVWKDENGITKQTSLPVNNRYGVTFHAAVINKELQYSIAKNKTSDSLNTLHINAQMGNYQVYKADLIIKNEMETYTVKFAIDSIPTGLMQFNLFDKGWNPLQQRMIFINDTATRNKLLIIRDTINTNPKGKNSIEIILSDSMVTNLSVSIADVNFYNEPNTHSITQDLLLNTQLKNLNQDAGSFLNDNNIIDLVTLTHQWKKYDRQKLIHKEEVKPGFLDNYISLSINYKEKNLALPPNDALNLIINNKGMGKQFYNLKPISQTAFKKTDLIFFDSVKVAYQMDKNKELVNYLTISKTDTLEIAQTIPALQSEISFQNVTAISVQNNIEIFTNNNSNKFNGVKILKDVKVKSKYKGNPILNRIDELDRFYTSGMFSGARGFQFNVIDDTLGVAANNNLQDYLRYRVPDLKLHKGSFGVFQPIFKEPWFIFVPTLLFINEMDMTIDTSGGFGDAMSLVNMSDVAYVKYIPGLVIGGTFRSTSGAIYIYTKTGREKGPPVKGLPFVYIKGYNQQKEFINPNYYDKDLLKQPDLRATLYWNPNVIMDKTNNKVQIEYYNNDISKKLLLTIEGVNAFGKLIHIEKIIE